MNPALYRLIVSTGILVAGVLIGMFAKSVIGLVFLAAGIAGFIWTGGIQAFKDTFYNRY